MSRNPARPPADADPPDPAPRPSGRRVRRVRRVLQVLSPLAAAALFAVAGTGTAQAAIPIGQPQSGSMTYYNDAGYGACGTQIDASTQELVAVSYQWWTAANPNADPLCQGISVEVSYGGQSITVPVEDKCPTCDAGHIDLSEPAFAQLAPLDQGVVNGITWQFVDTGSSGTGGATTSTDGSGGTAAGGTDSGTSGSGGATGSGGTGSGCAAPWDAGTSYSTGDEVAYAGHDWTATYYSTGAVPNDPASWAVWHDDGPCG